MRTKEGLIESGFNPMSENSNGMQVWAKFSGYEDTVKYVYYKEKYPIEGTDRFIEYVGEVQTVSLNTLMMFKDIFDGLVIGGSLKREWNPDGIIPSVIWKETWKNNIFKK